MGDHREQAEAERRVARSIARQSMQDEIERLRTRARTLHMELAQPRPATGDASRAAAGEEMRRSEELALVTERLRLAQHDLDGWEPGAAGAGPPAAPGGLAPPPRAGAADGAAELPPAGLDPNSLYSQYKRGWQCPLAAAAGSSARAELLTAARASDGKHSDRATPLGLRLLSLVRQQMLPTLEDQLGGLDSPLQPPSIIAAHVERTLMRHLGQLTEEAGEGGPSAHPGAERDGFRPLDGSARREGCRAGGSSSRASSHTRAAGADAEQEEKGALAQQLSAALVEMQRALIRDVHTMSHGGKGEEARLMREQVWNHPV